MSEEKRKELRDYSKCLQQEVLDDSGDFVDEELGWIGSLIQELLEETER